MSNTPTMFEDDSQPLIQAQDALNKLLQVALAQTTPRVQELIQIAMQNGGQILLEAELYPEAVYRFSLHYRGKTTALSVVFLNEAGAETVH